MTDGFVSEFERHGLACAVRLGAFGAPCGYVRLPEGTVLGSEKVASRALDVHGGVTFHGELPGREGTWVGFDTAHALDFTDRDGSLRPAWTVAMAEAETRRLADQVADFARGEGDGGR